MLLISSEIFDLEKLYIRIMDDENREALFIEVDQPELKQKIFSPLHNLNKYAHRFFHKRFAILGDFRIGKTELGQFILHKLSHHYSEKDCIMICINSYQAKDKESGEIDDWIYNQWLIHLEHVKNPEFAKCVSIVLNTFKETKGYDYSNIKPNNFIEKLILICDIYKEYLKINKNARFVVEFDQANVIYDNEKKFVPFHQFWRNFQGYWEDVNLFRDLRIFIFVIGHQNWKDFAALVQPSGKGAFDVLVNYNYWTNENLYQLFKKRLKYSIKPEFHEEYLNYFLSPGIVEFFENKLGTINTVEYLDAFFGEEGYLEKFFNNFYKNKKEHINFLDFCERFHRKEEYDETYFKGIEQLFIDIPGADYMHTFLYLSDNQSEPWYQEFFRLIRHIFKNGAVTYGSKIFNNLRHLKRDFLKENFVRDPFDNVIPNYLPAIFLENKDKITLDPSFRDKLAAVSKSKGRGDHVTRLKSYIESQRIRSNKFLESRDGKEMINLLDESLELSEKVFSKVQEWSLKNYFGVIEEWKPFTNNDLLPFYHLREVIFRLKQFYKGNSTIWSRFDDEARATGIFIIEKIFPKNSPAQCYINLSDDKPDFILETNSNIEIMRILNALLINLMGKINIFDSVLIEKDKRRSDKKLEDHRFDAYEGQVVNELVNRVGKFKGAVNEKSDYHDFLNQFPVEIRPSMVKVLKNLIYFAQDEIVDKLTQTIENLPYSSNSTLYIGVFDNLVHHSNAYYSYVMDKTFNINGKKAYCYKTSALVNKLNRLTEDQDITIVFVDDVVGAGQQFVRSYKKYFEKDFKKYGLDKKKNIKLYLVSCVGSSESLKYISDNTILNEDTIRYCKTIREQDKVFCAENWKDQEELERLKEFLQNIDPDYWDGWKRNPSDSRLKGLEFLVLMEWNVPNSTISCLWKETEDWKALFPRS